MKLVRTLSIAILSTVFAGTSLAGPGGTIDYTRYGPVHVLEVTGSPKTGAFTVQAVRPNGTTRNTGQSGSGNGTHLFLNLSGVSAVGPARRGEKVQITWQENGSTITTPAALAMANNVSNVTVASVDPVTPTLVTNVNFTVIQDALAPFATDVGYWPQQVVNVSLPENFTWTALPVISSTNVADMVVGIPSITNGGRDVEFPVLGNFMNDPATGFTLSLGSVQYDGSGVSFGDDSVVVRTGYDFGGTLFDSSHEIGSFMIVPEPAGISMIVGLSALLVRRKR